MSRFQAQTNAVLEQELEDLRERLGLRPDQKADLLRELTALASWVVRQAEAGKRIEARRGRDVVALDTAVLDRLRRTREQGLSSRVQLDDAEVERLAEVLDRGFAPTPEMREVLSRLASGRRRPPKLRWNKRPR